MTMRPHLALLLLGSMAGVALCGCAPSGGQAVGDLRIDEPWVRAALPEVSASAGYLTVRNLGDRDDRLMSVSSASAGRIEMHEVRTENGLMKMQHLEQGVAIPAGAAVALQPGGYHLMLMDLQQPLSAGTIMTATLHFEHAGAVEVAFQIRDPGSSGAASHIH